MGNDVGLRCGVKVLDGALYHGYEHVANIGPDSGELIRRSLVALDAFI